jgi:beta-glucosidase
MMRYKCFAGLHTFSAETCNMQHVTRYDMAMELTATVAYRDPTLTIEERVEDLLARMTLAEKIGQMTQVEKNSITPQDVGYHKIGSILSGGGGNPTPNTPSAWREMVTGFQDAALATRLGIPLIYGVDAVHGHNNMWSATVFPHNVGLGATRNPALVAETARVTARELLAVGVHWDFAPAVSVPQNPSWGRTYEGFSSDTAVVSELGAAYIRGLQTDNLEDPHAVLASAKHFVGDGGTTWGTTKTAEWIPGNVWRSNDDRWSIDQGDTRLDEATLRRIHLPPYAAAIAAGAQCIMVSYSSWNGQKMHGHGYLLTEVLKGELGFQGFLVSDWMGIDQLDEDYYTCVVRAINAGVDMIMVPFDFQRFITTLTKAVANHEVLIERLNDAVRRILRVKVMMGLFDRPYGDADLLSEVGSEAHRAVARQAVRESLTVLKNEGGVLPLAKETRTVLVAGQGADDIGLQCGGWTIEWTGRTGAITEGTTFLEALKTIVASDTKVVYDVDASHEDGAMAAVGIVVLAEHPYAEGEGDRLDLRLSEDDIDLVQRMRGRCQKLVAVLYSGRPLILEGITDICDGIVAAWLPGTEGAGIADGLFGDSPLNGKLPYRWEL